MDINCLKMNIYRKTLRFQTLKTAYYIYFIWRKDCFKVLWTNCRGGTVTQKAVVFGTPSLVWDARVNKVGFGLTQD